jgi:hypothetical protein
MGRAISEAATPRDPNSLIGPAGYGPDGYIQDSGTFGYRINFENEPSATAPAQEVTITDQLSSNLNWSTFDLTEIGFGDELIVVPADSQHFETTVPMTYNGTTFDVEIEAGLNAATGQVSATFQSLDPNTDLPPDVLTGFLPPEDGTGRGMGYIAYTIDPKAGLATGAQITNVALVSFDGQPQIATDQVDPHDPSQGIDPAKEALNTIDASLPSSTVLSLPATTNNPSFLVQWTGTDNASGIASYNIYVSDDGGAYTLWQNQTTNTQATYTGQVNHTYAFYSIATSNVGLKETAPSGAEASTTVVPATPPVATDTSYLTSKNTPLTVSSPGLLADCSDTDGDTLTTALVTGPTHGTVSVNANGSFTYTPTTGYTGTDSFTYTANDGTVASNVATVSLSVLGDVSNEVSISQGPFGRDSSPGMWSATMYVYNTSGSTISGPIQVLFTNLAPGVAMVNNTGTYQNSPYITVTTGTLAPGASAGVVLQVYNPARTDVTYTPVTYSGGLPSVNHAPLAGNTGYTMGKNNTLTVSTPGLLANCFDADGGSLTAALVNGPAHGTVSVNANGSFTYTPATDYYGTDSFTYKANDGRADSNVATVSLAILNVTNVTNQVTVWQTSFSRDSAPGEWSATLTVTNISSAALTGPIQVLLTDLAQGVTMVNNDGTFQNSPYITVTLDNLAPNSSASVVIQVYDPTRTDITYIAIIYSGGLPT